MTVRRKSTGLLPRKELARVQQAVLKAALLGEPLPGGSSVQFADKSFILRHDAIYLVDENLAGVIPSTGLPKPLRVVSREELRRETQIHRDVAYLHFRKPEAADEGGVWITLEGKLASSDASRHSMGLSSVQVRLRKVEGRWEPAGETRGLAE